MRKIDRAHRAQLRAPRPAGGAYSRGGQSTLEYILILAAVLLAVIVAAKMAIGPAVKTSMDESQGVIEKSSQKMKTELNLP